jgi:DNA-binding PadR family transcriptional regulator
MSNSFIILTALNRVNKPLNTIQISEIIVLHTKGRIYKISVTLKDSLEHGLKREGYVEGLDVPAQKALRKPVKMSLYSITPKGKKALEGWIAFLSACS